MCQCKEKENKLNLKKEIDQKTKHSQSINN